MICTMQPPPPTHWWIFFKNMVNNVLCISWHCLPLNYFLTKFKLGCWWYFYSPFHYCPLCKANFTGEFYLLNFIVCKLSNIRNLFMFFFFLVWIWYWWCLFGNEGNCGVKKLWKKPGYTYNLIISVHRAVNDVLFATKYK